MVYRDIKFDLILQNKNTGYIHHRIYHLAELMRGVSNLFDYENYTHITHRQFTGLKDKNGKEIYEGDIVRFKSIVTAKDDEVTCCWCDGVRESKVLLNHEIAFDKYRGWYAVENERAKAKYFWCSKEDVENDWEVIGNIYENGDLLNENLE